MDHQGAGRSRSAADTRRQPPWPSQENADGSGVSESTGPLPAWQPETGAPGFAAPGSGPSGYGTSGSGPAEYGSTEYGPAGYEGAAYGGTRSGPQRVLGPGTGPQRLVASGSGAQAVLGTGSGAQRVLGPGTGPQRLIGSGSGAQPVLNAESGGQPVLNAGSGGQPALGSPGSSVRTPTRGFPPGRKQPEPAQGGFSPWHTPREPLTAEDGEQAADGGYGPDGGYGADGPGSDMYPPDDTDPMGQAALQAPMDFAGPVSSAGRRRGERTKRRSRARTALIAAAAVVVAAAGVFAGYKFLYEPRVNAPVPATLRLPTNAPGSPGFDKTLGKWQHIGTRAEDPDPLTIAGLYPPQFVLNGTSYVRTAASVTKKCSLAVYGADLQAALQSGHCTQVLRASYISGDGKMMGTVGVVNLITSSAAQKAGQVTGPQEIIAPLTGKKGATSKLGSGTGVVQAEIKGHYLILMWAEFTNLKSPSGSAQRQVLEQFAANLVTGSANINLSTRMLTGKP